MKVAMCIRCTYYKTLVTGSLLSGPLEPAKFQELHWLNSVQRQFPIWPKMGQHLLHSQPSWKHCVTNSIKQHLQTAVVLRTNMHRAWRAVAVRRVENKPI